MEQRKATYILEIYKAIFGTNITFKAEQEGKQTWP
jgi:hypothetical protein